MTRPLRCVLLLATAALAGSFLGCETNGWLIDPQRTGYFQTTPTSIPILDRIDVIEQARDTHVVRRKPTSEDLIPKAVEYRLAAGDTIRVVIPGLLGAGQPVQPEYTISSDGTFNLPLIEDKNKRNILAGGRTLAEVQDKVKELLEGEGAIKRATVSVQLVEGRAYQYRVLGSVEAPGLYALNKPDLRLIDALATARGAAPTTTRVLVTRKPSSKDASLNFDVDYQKASTSEPVANAPVASPGSATPPSAGAAPATPAPASGISGQDIDNILDALPNQAEPAGTAPAPASAPAGEPASSAPASEPPPTPPAPEPAPASEPTRPATSPGMLSSTGRQEPPVDIDTLESAKSKDQAATQPQSVPLEGDRFTFDAATQTWVKVGQAGGETSTAVQAPAESPAAPAAGKPVTGQAAAGLRAPGRTKNETKKAFDSEVIEINYNDLVRGDANLNVVIKPGDMIFCDQGDVGVVYIDGLIARPGVYNLPTSGKLTLSRLVAAAGGLGELAIPQRVDLVRRLGEDKEACIRVNLAAIRNRAEPDIFMKPDDHVNIGTNFWATPLAVIRNGFRMTYGFGFLVDRNWGNDIFGPPPTNVLGQ